MKDSTASPTADGSTSRSGGVPPDSDGGPDAESAAPDREARALLAAIVESSDEAIISESLDGIITSWNRNAERLYGYSSEEAIGRSTSMLQPTDGPDDPSSILERIRHGERVDPYDTIRLSKDGSPVVIRQTVSPLRNHADEIIGAATAARKVGAKTELHDDMSWSEKRWFTTLQSIGDAVITTDPLGNITSLNPAAEQLTGWTQREALGKRCSEILRILNKETRQEVESPVTKVLRGVRIAGLVNQSVLRTRNGSERFIGISGSPVHDNTGGLRGVVLVVRDVTKRKRAEAALRESEERFHSLFNSMTEGFALTEILCDKNGEPYDYRFVDINPAYERLTGLQRDRIVGTTQSRIMPGEDPMWVRSLGEVALTGKSAHLEGYSVGLRKHIELFAYCPKPNHVATVFRDVTARKRAEQEMADLNARLQRAMAETHHRVKNNLQVISALIEMQTDAFDLAVPTDAMRALRCHVSGLAAIHDILTEQSRSGGGVDTLPARQAIAKLLPLLELTAHGRRIRATIGEIQIPTRQAGALTLIVNELVSNALRHGRGEVRVTLTASRKTARLVIEDEGDGFPEGFDPVISGNTGLELVTSLSSIDLGGKTAFDNRSKGGARVTVKFPLVSHKTV